MINKFGTYIFDLDGTICPIKKQEEKYEDLVPFPQIVSKMRELKKQGFNILIYTSRNMKTYDGNVGLINANTAKVILKWLEKWDIPYDEILYGKPWPGENGFYVDDRAIRPQELLNYTQKELKEICDKDRLKGE